MKKALFTYGFSILLVFALIILALLQYKWIGSVSEAEKIRLENSIDASTENFLADFNSIISGVRSFFSLSLAQNESPSAEDIQQLYSNWQKDAEYPDLIEGIYLISTQNNSEPLLYYDPEQKTLTPAKAETIVRNQLYHTYPALGDTNFTFSVRNMIQPYPDFGFPTLLMVPVQKVSLITLNEEKGLSEMDVRLSMNVSSELLVLRLNDSLIKNKIIPALAERYFSQDYRELYNTGIYKKEADSVMWYYKNDMVSLPESPMVDKPITYGNSTELLLMEGTRFRLSDLNVGLPGDFNFKNIADSLSINRVDIINTEKRRVETGKTVQFRFNNSTTIDSAEKGLPELTPIQSDIKGRPWNFVLSFKAGSMDAYVNETRIRNLLISFAILFILGISGILIMYNASRSRKLAEQQMAFVSGVSHELKTPVTVIRSAAENMLEGVVKDERRQKQYAEMMLKEGKRLSAMVDQILSYAGIQSGNKALNLIEYDTETLVSELNDELQNVLNTNGTEIQYFRPEKPIVFEADAEALKTALINLLLNAEKFSGDYKTIRLRIERMEYSGGEAVAFKVEDDGMGIPEDELKDIFKPFFRGKKASDLQIKGNGIGLSLVKRIAEEHGGTVRVDSKPGKGSIFTLILPLKQSMV